MIEELERKLDELYNKPLSLNQGAEIEYIEDLLHHLKKKSNEEVHH